MNDLVERVARALCVEDGKDPDGDIRVRSDRPMLLIPDLPDPENWKLYIKKARVAIEAMGEPTDDEPYVPNENTVRIPMEDWRKINRCIDDTSYANDADFWHHMNDLIVRESSVE